MITELSKKEGYAVKEVRLRNDQDIAEELDAILNQSPENYKRLKDCVLCLLRQEDHSLKIYLDTVCRCGLIIQDSFDNLQKQYSIPDDDPDAAMLNVACKMIVKHWKRIP